MQKPSLFIATGIALLLAAGGTLWYRSRAMSPDAAVAREGRHRQIAGNDRTGWNVTAPAAGRGSGDVAARSQPAAPAQPVGDLDIQATDDFGESVDAPAPAHAAQPHGASAAKPAPVTAEVPPAAPAVAAPDASNTPADANGEQNEPVLSIPFERSAEPEKGDTAPIVADGVTFDSEGARFSVDSQFVVPNAGNVQGAAGTITFWLQPEWAGDVESDASLVQLRTSTFENRLQIFKNGRYLRFLFCDNTGIESGVGTDVSGWKPGERHMITATWGDGVTVLYIDGRSYGARDYDGELEVGPETPLYIGSDHPGGGPGARSAISNFQIYSRALSADEIANLYSQTVR